MNGLSRIPLLGDIYGGVTAAGDRPAACAGLRCRLQNPTDRRVILAPEPAKFSKARSPVTPAQVTGPTGPMTVRYMARQRTTPLRGKPRWQPSSSSCWRGLIQIDFRPDAEKFAATSPTRRIQWSQRFMSGVGIFEHPHPDRHRRSSDIGGEVAVVQHRNHPGLADDPAVGKPARFQSDQSASRMVDLVHSGRRPAQDLSGAHRWKSVRHRDAGLPLRNPETLPLSAKCPRSNDPDLDMHAGAVCDAIPGLVRPSQIIALVADKTDSLLSALEADSITRTSDNSNCELILDSADRQHDRTA